MRVFTLRFLSLLALNSLVKVSFNKEDLFIHILQLYIEIQALQMDYRLNSIKLFENVFP